MNNFQLHKVSRYFCNFTIAYTIYSAFYEYTRSHIMIFTLNFSQKEYLNDSYKLLLFFAYIFGTAFHEILAISVNKTVFHLFLEFRLFIIPTMLITLSNHGQQQCKKCTKFNNFIIKSFRKYI